MFRYILGVVEIIGFFCQSIKGKSVLSIPVKKTTKLLLLETALGMGLFHLGLVCKWE